MMTSTVFLEQNQPCKGLDAAPGALKDPVKYFHNLMIPKASKKQPSKPIIILHTIPGTANTVGRGHIKAAIRKINPSIMTAIFFTVKPP